MFTKNWYKFISLQIGQGPETVKLTYTTVSGTTVNGQYNNDALHIACNVDHSYVPSIYKLRTSLDTSSYPGVYLGNGTIEPTYDDYWLSGDIISTYTYTATVTSAFDDEGLVVTALYTLTNTGSEAFTVNEIGLVGNSNPSSGKGSKYNALLERTLLESPVTIEPGEVGQITYTIRMNYPTT